MVKWKSDSYTATEEFTEKQKKSGYYGIFPIAHTT